MAKHKYGDVWYPITMLAVMTGAVAPRYKNEFGLNADTIAFGFFLLLMVWLLWPSNTPDDDGAPPA